MMLDGHFVIEHAGAPPRRAASSTSTAPPASGAASAIADAGGWSARHARPRTWTCRTARSCAAGSSSTCPRIVVSPAELPVEMYAFKSQQFRWAKGSIQVAKKLLPTILRSNVTFGAEARGVLPPHQQPRLPAACCCCRSCCLPNLLAAHAPRLARGAAHRPAAVLRHHAVDRVVLHDVAARDRAAAQPDTPRIPGGAQRLPLMMSLGIGLCINQTRAVLEALLGRRPSSCARPSTASARRSRAGRARSTAPPSR